VFHHSFGLSNFTVIIAIRPPNGEKTFDKIAKQRVADTVPMPGIKPIGTSFRLSKTVTRAVNVI
jgi:hypothetical protein